LLIILKQAGDLAADNAAAEHSDCDCFDARIHDAILS
jgi:hypothetical protein